MEFFKEYPEEEVLYPLYQFYQYYYVLAFLLKQSPLDARLQPLLFKFTQLVNRHLPLLKSAKALLKTVSLLTRIYRQFQLDRLALSQIETYILSNESLLSQEKNNPRVQSLQNHRQEIQGLQKSIQLLYSKAVPQKALESQHKTYQLIDTCLSFKPSEGDHIYFPKVIS